MDMKEAMSVRHMVRKYTDRQLEMNVISDLENRVEENNAKRDLSIRLMLYAQTQGLNTWYVGGTFNRSVSKFVEGRKVVGIIAVGYGENNGKPHKSKKPSEITTYQGSAPEWFKQGVEASLLAPTALNKKDYMIVGKGDEVTIRNDNGIFSGVNRGLIRYHFELGAGKENFRWIK